MTVFVLAFSVFVLIKVHAPAWLWVLLTADITAELYCKLTGAL